MDRPMAIDQTGRTDTRFRVVHVLRAPVGGLFRHVIDLTQEQIARGHDVGLITDSTTGGAHAAEILDRLKPSLRLGLLRIPMHRQPSFFDFATAVKIGGLYAISAVDVIHGHGAKGGLYTRLPSLWHGATTSVRAYTPHGGSFGVTVPYSLQRIYMFVERLLEPLTDAYLFESAFVAARFAQYVGKTHAVTKTIPNGIGPDEFVPVQPLPNAADLIYVGELRREKGIEILIDAMFELTRGQGKDLRLVLVGHGPDKQRFVAQAERLGLGQRITFMDPMPAREAFKHGRILVLPSLSESLPYIILEAAAAALPIVATNVGDIGNIVSPYRDRLVPPNDLAALVASACVTCSNSHKPTGSGKPPISRLSSPSVIQSETWSTRFSPFIAKQRNANPLRKVTPNPLLQYFPENWWDFQMAAFSVNDLRHADPNVPASESATLASPASKLSALAESLAGLAPPPAYSRVVLVGSVRILEFMLVALTGFLAHLIHVAPSYGYETVYVVMIPSMAALTVITLQVLGTYRVGALRYFSHEALRVATGWTSVFLIAFAAVFVLKLDGDCARLWLSGWFLLGLAALIVERTTLALFVNHLSKAGQLERRTVIVGGGPAADELIEQLAAQQHTDLRICGIFDDRLDERSPDVVAGFPKLGTVNDLLEFARNVRLDLVIFTLPISAETRLLQMLRKLWVLPVDIRLAAHMNKLRFQPRAYSYIGSVPLLDVFDKPIADWDIVLKYLFDKIVGIFCLILVAPVMLVTALAIKIESRGPILFKQKRYGFNNELIEVFKFRSMYVDQLDFNAVKLVTRDDPRVTRVGRFIRKTSIDELPQLFNVVFKGDLSLVGPRPHAVHAMAAEHQYDEVVDGYFARHRVKPGITGWAQINGWRGSTDTPEKIQKRVECDLYYIENWSVPLDLYIILATPLALLKTENAY